jgi:uncharacterized membrane protein (DUF485 family)
MVSRIKRERELQELNSQNDNFCYFMLDLYAVFFLLNSFEKFLSGIFYVFGLKMTFLGSLICIEKVFLQVIGHMGLSINSFAYISFFV